MERRDFLKIAGVFGMTSFTGPLINQANASESTFDIDSLFESTDPAVLRLTDRVFQKCILEKVFPAAAPMKHNWIGPGGGYKGQWIWDTMFVADLMSILPGKEQIIRDVFQNFWDFQQRWNAIKPAYAHDMIPCAMGVGDDWQNTRHQFSQIPILAWGVERVYRRNGDKELVRQSLEPLERFHEWYWRERDVTNVGLAAVGTYFDREGAIPGKYGSAIQQARFETFDLSCDLDDLHLTRHPARKEKKDGLWYGDVLVAGNTAYLIFGEKCLARLAEMMGDHAMAQRRQARIDKAVDAMRRHMWDEAAGTFLSVKRDTLEKIPVATIGGWMALIAGVPTKAMAGRMAEALKTPAWQTPLPVPTVARNDQRWKSDDFWRGDVWPATNYQVACGLADYGYQDLAAEVADKTVANALKNGISEHYDSVSGRKLGVEYLGMTCTLVTMMLDGLSRKFQLKIRQ